MSRYFIMAKEALKTLTRNQALYQFIALASLVTILPFLIHVQWISGPIVNAILILALYLVNLRAALVLSVIPSIMALFGGLLPSVLAPVIPFIVISNGILVLSFYFWQETKYDEIKSFFGGLFFGSFLKFIFLFLSSRFIMSFFLKETLLTKVSQIMSWPQLFTALSGGLLAFAFLRFLRKV